MRVFEKDLVIGDRYYVDSSRNNIGYFVGLFPPEEGSSEMGIYFYPEESVPYIMEPDGTFGFMEEDDWYEEV